mmetsp:Transcript_8477/g.21121  ORF Transcript_8477/g.21121 Transcript_8477/m.21121 type:complete len:247 (+) Transcript_8477:390-1130(+)
MMSCDTTVSTLPRPMRCMSASLSLSRTSATTCPLSFRFARLRMTCSTSASALSGCSNVLDNTTTDRAVVTLTLSKSEAMRRVPWRNTTVVPLSCFLVMKCISSLSIFSFPSAHSTAMIPPPSDSLALTISLMNSRLFSVNPNITVWPFSTTSERPSRSAFILACTASTTRPSTTEKYRIPSTVTMLATARVGISYGELMYPPNTPAAIHVKAAQHPSCSSVLGSTEEYARPPPMVSTTARTHSAYD